MIAVVASVIALAIAETLARRGPDPVRWGAPGTRSALASALGLFATTIAAATGPGTRLVGLVPVAIGIALRGLAIRALGDAFSSETVLVPGRVVVRGGVVRWTRHPSELGLALFAFGLALLGDSAIAAAFAGLVVVPSAAVRIAGEERLLRARGARRGWFGGEGGSSSPRRTPRDANDTGDKPKEASGARRNAACVPLASRGEVREIA